MLKKSQLFIIIFSIPLIVLSQSAKKYFSAGEKFEQANNLQEAITNYSKAVEIDPLYEKAYIARAVCYEKLNMKQEAVEDYRKAITFSPKEKEHYYNAGRLLVLLEKYTEADQMFRKALERDKSYAEVIDLEIGVIHKTKDFKYGLTVAQMLFDIKENSNSRYQRALMQDSLGNFVEAEKDYKSSKFFDSKFIPAYVGLALVQAKLNKQADALATCETALTKDPNNIDVFYARSVVYATKNDYQNALTDITKVVVSKPSLQNYKMRAAYYTKLGQFQNAVSDYALALKYDYNDLDSYLKRASCYEQLQNYKMAVADYNMVASLAKGNAKIEAIVVEAKKKVFELSRESNKPEVILTSHKLINDKYVKLPGDKDEIVFKGYVKDASQMASITINNIAADFKKDSLNPEFTVKVAGLTKTNDVTIIATDVYNNVQSLVYKVERTEVNKPVIVLETPATSSDNEIFLENNSSDMYVQGKIKDESLIESISIEGVAASYSPTALYPDFSAQISIANKTKINIVVKDVYGNETKQEYSLNRSGAEAALNNPMGNTWIVFIENSKYQTFASLDGPAKDVTTMKSALANYKVSKILHKKDMTKTEMEKFFSIELRDYVKNQNVQSLLIWYAGHGKYVSPTGYWVPVDGRADDEFSYFGINNLKAAMQSYTGKLKHLLVVTDACESGPSFLLAMRGGLEDQRCENSDLIKSKSAQVITSAGYELASDNSQFTKTFASQLVNNTDACIPIDKIAKKVTSAVVAAGNQAPKFGKIKDLEDEGGTFFFIKK